MTPRQERALQRFVDALPTALEQQFAEQCIAGVTPNVADWPRSALSKYQAEHIAAVVEGITKHGQHTRHFFLPELHECACGEPAGECPKCGAPITCQVNGRFPRQCPECSLTFAAY